MDKQILLSGQLEDWDKFYTHEFVEVEGESYKQGCWNFKVPEEGQPTELFYRHMFWHEKGILSSIILDVGCRAGVVSIGYAELGYTVFGIDPSKFAIEEAKKAAMRRGITSSVSFYHAFAQDLSEFEDNSIGSIYCGNTLEHIPEEQLSKALDEFVRVLQPGKYAVGNIPVNALEDPAHFVEFDKSELEKRLKQHAFSDVKTFMGPDKYKNEPRTQVYFMAKKND